MHKIVLIEALLFVFLLFHANQKFAVDADINICHFPILYHYPCEAHSLQTSDGYILTIARIPYSRRHSRKTKNEKRPVVFLMHGIEWSSNCWLIPDPSDGLAYMLSDAGYDVWLGNARGNVYSKRHATLSPSSPEYWSFSWHEIAVYDLPAMLDYILHLTKQPKLHYVGHSQGTTVFLVLFSTYPQIGSRIKTAHLLAPVGYVHHTNLNLIGNLADILGRPSEDINQFGRQQLLLRSNFLDSLPRLCDSGSLLQPLCSNLFFTLTGYSDRLNMSLLEDILQTYPSGGSWRQLIHFLQEKLSGQFRQYDYGVEKNLRYYSSPIPPRYKVERIKTQTPMNFYYGDTDDLVSPIDVHRLAKKMPNTVELNRVLGRPYGHIDVLMATDVREVLNECILSKMEKFEGRKFRINTCCNLSSKWHCSSRHR